MSDWFFHGGSGRLLGEVGSIRVRAPNNRTPACFQSRYNPFLYFCDVVSLTRICGFVSYGFVDLRALSCGNVMWECFPSTACLPALQGLLPSFTSSVAFKLWVALEFEHWASKVWDICEEARSLIQYLWWQKEGFQGGQVNQVWRFEQVLEATKLRRAFRQSELKKNLTNLASGEEARRSCEL